MDTNEIMVNEEVVETTEQIAKTSSGNGCAIVVGIGLTLLAGVVTYKYVVKPLMAKIKAEKKSQTVYEEKDIIDSTEINNESDEDDE